MNKIIPAILESDFSEINSKLNLIKDLVHRVEIDICDGIFVKAKSWPFNNFLDFETRVNQKKVLPFLEKIDYSAHLMVNNPGDIIDDLIKIGFSRVFIHLEVGSDQCFALIDEWGKSVELGIALKLETEIEEIKGFINKIRFIQLMARSHLGEQGYKLDEKIFEKIINLKGLGFKGLISVDGGINPENTERLFELGADDLIIGSAIWFNDSPVENLDNFKKI